MACRPPDPNGDSVLLSPLQIDAIIKRALAHQLLRLGLRHAVSLGPRDAVLEFAAPRSQRVRFDCFFFMGKVPLGPRNAVLEFAATGSQAPGIAVGWGGGGGGGRRVVALNTTLWGRLVEAMLVYENGAVGDVDGYAGFGGLVGLVVVALGEIEAVGVAARGWVEGCCVRGWVHVVAILIDDPMVAGNGYGNFGAFGHLVDCTCQELRIDLRGG